MKIALTLLYIVLSCAPAVAADVLPTSTYFPVLPLGATDDALPQWVPVAANHALDGAHTGLTRAVIVIHDETRDANGALTAIETLAGGANATTMIIAPQFLLPSDLVRIAAHLPEEGRAFAAWQYTDWPSGGDSIAALPQKGISSFTVVDLLLMYLSDRNAFPDLRSVVIVGVGTGAVFVQHYAAFSAAAPVMDKEQITMRYVVAAAPSYLYMTVNRPLGGRKGFGQPDAKACPDYNAYPYGLDRLNTYARHAGANLAKSDYATRSITYLNASTGDALPETSCAALIQGGDTAARADNYRLYLQSLYGDVAARTQIFAMDKKAKNDAMGLLGSACGMSALFGDGVCAVPVAP